MPIRIAQLSLRLLAGALACQEPVSGVDRSPRPGRPLAHEAGPHSKLRFAQLDAERVRVVDEEVSFWAVRGQEREVRMYVIDTADAAPEPEEILRFRVPKDGLLRHPDGRAVAAGDSVRITIRMVDHARLYFDFQPSGLRFDPAAPAEIRISFPHAVQDLNGDGGVDSDDRELWAGIAVWRQEREEDPWTALRTVRDGSHWVRAAVHGFTRYALASE